MPTATCTIGPLHLEDLEPHRFEDMMRQLLYDFRPWRDLEATGRSGADGSFDARGWEIIAGEAPETNNDAENGDADTAAISMVTDRLWLIQCKREKSIGPKKLIDYLEEIPHADRKQIYGVVLAAACDFSKKARDDFRAKVRELGFSEAYLWGKGEIEDMLFQPKNDHLLFAYFGVSLQTRRRAVKAEVRSKLAIKRKSERLLQQYVNVLVRDATDDRYPYLDEDKSKPLFERGRWRVFRFLGCFHDGLRFQARRHNAFLDSNGIHWDYTETINGARPSGYEDPWSEEADATNNEEAINVWKAFSTLPKENQGVYEVVIVLPYENVIDIDEKGDDRFNGPHIYTTQHKGSRGPFEEGCYISLHTTGMEQRHIDPEEKNRVEKFPRKNKK